MSILDAITNAAERHPEVNEQQHSSLVSSATQMFGNSGELSGLFNHAESQGLGHIVGSWIVSVRGSTRLTGLVVESADLPGALADQIKN